MPEFWTAPERPLDDLFFKFLNQDKLYSDRHWDKLGYVFENLAAMELAPTSQIINWLNNGLFAVAERNLNKDPEPFRHPYFTLGLTIMNIQDATVRDETWNSEFQSKIHQYLISENEDQIQKTKLAEAIGHTMSYLIMRQIREVEKIWK